MLYVETGREAPYTNAFPGEGKPSPGPPPRSASRKNEPHSYPIPLLPIRAEQGYKVRKALLS